MTVSHSLAPGGYGILILVLAHVVSKVIAPVAAIMADLSETERVHYQGKRKVDKNKKIKGKQRTEGKKRKGWT